MDATTNLKARLPSPHVTEGPARAPHRSDAMSLTAAQIHQSFGGAAVFKKTPYIPGLKPPGRDVAKDISEVSGIPLLIKTRLDNGHRSGECTTVTGRTIAENLKSVKWNPNHAVVGPVEKVSHADA